MVDDSYRNLFPAMLTNKYCMVERIVGDLNNRTAGNSQTHSKCSH